MTLYLARQVLHEVDGKSYTWLQAWGLSTIREALRVVGRRKSATDADREIAESIQTRLSRKW